tara:strand:+ start:575 stop:922 length:348 start_codon:yes stop_codon:yes gene_type:complete
MAITKDDIAPKFVNGVAVEMTEEEKQARVDEWNQAIADMPAKKLGQVRKIRDKLLNESDWKVTKAKEKGTTLSTSFKNWRDALRDIPADYTTEAEYDELLERNADGSMKHSVWSE